MAVVASASSAPIAAIFMGVELFGADSTLYVAGACVAAYLIIGHRSVYPAQQIAFSKSSWILARADLPGSFVVRPHSQYAHSEALLEHLVDKAMLNVDAARISAIEIPYEFLVGGRILKWIIGQDFEKFLGLLFQTRSRELLCIFQRVLGINDDPLYQTSAFALLAKGSAMPFLMDSRMPGTDKR